MGNGSQDGQNLYQPDQVITPTHAQPIPEHGVQLQAAMAATAPLQPPVEAPSAPMSPPSPPVPDVPPAAPTFTPPPAPPEPAAPVVSDQSPIQADGEEETTPDVDGPIQWTASEFVANQKSVSWYVSLGVAALLLGAVIWLLTRDFFPTIAVLIGVLLLGIYAGRQPREESYMLDEQGITIGNRHYGYHEFRSFSVVPDGAFLSIELAPLKRFAVDTTIYVAPDDEDRIIDHLSQYLPMEEAKSRFTDNLMRRIHF